MSRRPLYTKNRRGSYFVMILLLAAVVWLVYGYEHSFPLQSLVDNSSLRGRAFQGRVEEVTAPVSGVKGWFIAEKDSPLVAVSFIFERSGTAYDAPDKSGLANFVASTLEYGAGDMDAETLRETASLNGIILSFDAGTDSFNATMTAPQENVAQAAAIMQQVLTAPRFAKSYIAGTRAQILKVLAAEKESPAKELQLAFNKLLYGTHPYGNNPLGTPETVAALDRSDLKQFVKEHFGRNNLYVGIAGSLSKEEAAGIIDRIFGSLPETVNLPALADPAPDFNRPVLTISRRSGQNIAAFAARGTCRKCADFYPLYIADYLFGGAGLNSRLNQQLREKSGLTYGAYSSLTLHDHSNLLTAGFSATADKFEQAVRMFADEWKQAGQKGFTAEELQSAKNYLTASFNLRFASTSGIAEMLAYMQKYDLGTDFLQQRNHYVESVTLQQLNQAAAKYFGAGYLGAYLGIFDKGEN